jgi:hypothetical protein
MSDQSTQRPLPDNTKHSKEGDTHAPAGFEHAYLRHRPRGDRTCQLSYTTCKLMELDPSVSKNSILDVYRPTTSYITKKKKTNEFVTRTCQENFYTIVSMAAIILLMLYM